MSNNPLESAVEHLKQQHGAEVLAVASMVHLSKKLLSHCGTANNVDLGPMIKTLDKCVESHLIDRGIHPHALSAALAALQRAGATTAMGELATA